MNDYVFNSSLVYKNCSNLLQFYIERLSNARFDSNSLLVFFRPESE